MTNKISFGTRVRIDPALGTYGGLEGTVVDPAVKAPYVRLAGECLVESANGSLYALDADKLQVISGAPLVD